MSRPSGTRILGISLLGAVVAPIVLVGAYLAGPLRWLAVVVLAAGAAVLLIVR